MLQRVPFVALLMFSAYMGTPLEAQTQPSRTIAPSPSTTPPFLADRPIIGVLESDGELQLKASLETRESAERGTAVLSALVTGIFFGAMLGGIRGGNKEGCDECDYWGAVSGGFIGGLAGLALPV